MGIHLLPKHFDGETFSVDLSVGGEKTIKRVKHKPFCLSKFCTNDDYCKKITPVPAKVVNDIFCAKCGEAVVWMDETKTEKRKQDKLYKRSR